MSVSQYSTVTLFERRRSVDRRHVDEHVDAAKRRHRVRDDGAAVLGLAHIGHHGGRAASGRDDVGDGVVGFLLRPAIRQHQVHATCGERLCDDAADALAAGDDCDFAGQFHVGITQIGLDYAEKYIRRLRRFRRFFLGLCAGGVTRHQPTGAAGREAAGPGSERVGLEDKSDLVWCTRSCLRAPRVAARRALPGAPVGAHLRESAQSADRSRQRRVSVATRAVVCVVQIAILPQQLVDDDAAGGGDVE